MAKYLITVEIDVESDKPLDDTTKKLEDLLSDLIEVHNEDAIENEEGFLIFDYEVTEAFESTQDDDEDQDEDQENDNNDDIIN